MLMIIRLKAEKRRRKKKREKVQACLIVNQLTARNRAPKKKRQRPPEYPLTSPGGVHDPCCYVFVDLGPCTPRFASRREQ